MSKDGTDGAAGGAESDGADGGTGRPDDGRDPFDSFEGYDDREGDPFDSFEDGDGTQSAGGASDDSDGIPSDATDPANPADTTDSANSAGAQSPDPDPFEYRDGRSADAAADSASAPPADDAAAGDEPADPLADVTVSDEDPFESNAGAFERADVAGIDPDEVWERLTADPDPEPPEEGEDDVVEVSKHSYCEGCEFFSAPPSVSCAHEGTEILEFVDVDTVRVADCPVVAERRELEDE